MYEGETILKVEERDPMSRCPRPPLPSDFPPSEFCSPKAVDTGEGWGTSMVVRKLPFEEVRRQGTSQLLVPVAKHTPNLHRLEVK